MGFVLDYFIHGRLRVERSWGIRHAEVLHRLGGHRPGKILLISRVGPWRVGHRVRLLRRSRRVRRGCRGIRAGCNGGGGIARSDPGCPAECKEEKKKKKNTTAFELVFVH